MRSDRLHGFWLCLCVLLGGITPQSVSAKVHVMIVADTMSVTGAAAQADLLRVQKEVGCLAAFLDDSLHIEVFTGKRVCVHELVTYLCTLPSLEEDSLVFYYLGHGFRTEKKDSAWPYLYLSTFHEGLDLNVVIDELVERKPRLGLIIADCCNNVLTCSSWRSGFTSSIQQPEPIRHRIAQGYKALFSEFSGIICACGSTPGAVAYCSQRGHLFTEAFWWSVHREVLQEHPSWDLLFARCAKHLELLQTPYFEVLHYAD